MHLDTKKRISFFIQIIVAVLSIAFFAQIEIILPINKNGIPITGQTFAILLVGYFLGLKKGVITVLIYLIIGAMGLPVFAGGASGFEVLSKNSAGFLYGFIFGVAATGYFGEKGWGNNFLKCFIGMVIGTMIISASGVLFLTFKYDFASALKFGFYPFLWGALIKTILGAMIPPIYYNLLKVK
jgi:biotin transport system substrate-specific component